MELNTLHGVLLMADTLTDSRGAVRVRHPCRNLETFRQREVSSGQGVISGHRKALFQAPKNSLGVVSQGRRLAMQPLASGCHLASVDVEHALPAMESV